MNRLWPLILIVFASLAVAVQFPLTEYGFLEITNLSPGTTQCRELVVSLAQEQAQEKGAGILSINAEFSESKNDSTYVSVLVNEKRELILWKENFSCASLCWARIFLPELKENETKLKICSVLGGASEKLTVSENSFIGIYDTASLEIKTTSPEIIFLGQRAKMSIIVKNTGSKAANVFVQFVHPDTRAKVPITSFDIVEGDSSASTVIEASDTKKFDYYIKPTLVSSYNLPSAALFFTNNFGEEQVIISNHQMMSVLNPQQISVSLISSSKSSSGGIIFKAIIKNNWPSEFKGKATISPQTKFNESLREIIVSPLSEKEIYFESNPVEAKELFFVTIRDENSIFSSNEIEIQGEAGFLSPQLVLAVLGVLFGAVVFSWIYFAKK